eukprot:TRINITY_DN86_c0_g7_i1.p1 TRINITY_DN86_c0_g7~~TRINITY_DN86_c0_g7_i1.p1  ORF type:complete len:419 (-),score=54.46 TRINITY_DN86_c0_g7_i1:1211-2302(-)
MKVDLPRRLLHINVRLPNVPPHLIIADALTDRLLLCTPRFSKNYILKVPYLHGITVVKDSASAEFLPHRHNLHIAARIDTIPSEAESVEHERLEAMRRERRLRFVMHPDGTRSVVERAPRRKRAEQDESANDASTGLTGPESQENNAAKSGGAAVAPAGGKPSARGALKRGRSTDGKRTAEGPPAKEARRVSFGGASDAAAKPTPQPQGFGAVGRSRKQFLADDAPTAIAAAEAAAAPEVERHQRLAAVADERERAAVARRAKKEKRESERRTRRAELAAARLGGAVPVAEPSGRDEDQGLGKAFGKKKKKLADLARPAAATGRLVSHKGDAVVSFGGARAQGGAKRAVKRAGRAAEKAQDNE